MSIQTTKLFYLNGAAAWVNPNTQFQYWDGAAWQATKRVYRFDGTNWVCRYSTPTVTCPDVTGSNSGNAASGSVTSAAAAPVIGGFGSGSYTYLWQYVSGDAGILCSNPASPTPTWSEASVPAGTTSAVWMLTLTDANSGAVRTVNINVSLTWTNTTLLLSVTGVDASGLFEISAGPASGTVATGTGGAAGGASPSGGNGDYTYAWTFVSGDAGIAINNASIQHPTWSKAMTTAGGTTTTTSAVWQISLNDTNGDGPVTANINVTLTIKSDASFPPLSVTADEAHGETDIAYHVGTYCQIVGTNELSANCQVSGGNGDYVFNWAYVSGDSGITIDSATIQNPTWEKFMCANFSQHGGVTEATAVWQVSVTDTAGNGPVTVQVTVDLKLVIENGP